MNIEAIKSILDEMEGVSGDMYDGSLTMHEDDFRDYARRIREALEEEPRRGAETRTPKEALREVRDRLSYFCARTNGKYDPPWAEELVGMIDEAVTDSHAIGDAAALREALTKVKEWMEHRIATRGFEFSPTFPTVLEDVVLPALAKPPRNCDAPYNDRVEMYGAFKDWCKSKGHTMEPMLAYDAFDWLLAPATKKGGDDGIQSAS